MITGHMLTDADTDVFVRDDVATAAAEVRDLIAKDRLDFDRFLTALWRLEHPCG